VPQLTLRRELAWAGGLLGLAVILGFMFHWPLVQASLRGNLTALLDQKRQERREVRFQGVKTIDLEQANRGGSIPGATSSPGFSAPSGV
jgi:hypothetical protein